MNRCCNVDCHVSIEPEDLKDIEATEKKLGFKIDDELEIEASGIYSPGCSGSLEEPPEPEMVEDLQMSIKTKCPKRLQQARTLHNFHNMLLDNKIFELSDILLVLKHARNNLINIDLADEVNKSKLEKIEEELLIAACDSPY